MNKLKSMSKKQLIAYSHLLEYQNSQLKDELEPLTILVPHIEKWKNHHLDTIQEYHKMYEQERLEEQLISPVYKTEQSTLKLEMIQANLNKMNLSNRTREVLQVVSTCKTQQEASEILGISQAAISKHISKARQEANRL